MIFNTSGFIMVVTQVRITVNPIDYLKFIPYSSYSIYSLVVSHHNVLTTPHTTGPYPKPFQENMRLNHLFQFYPHSYHTVPNPQDTFLPTSTYPILQLHYLHAPKTKVDIFQY